MSCRASRGAGAQSGSGIAPHAVGHLPLQDRLQRKAQVADQHQVRHALAAAFGLSRNIWIGSDAASATSLAVR